MINKFEFDWNVVAKIDPSYKQYLMDAYKLEPEETNCDMDEPTPIRRTERRQRDMDDYMDNELIPFGRGNLSDDELAIIRSLHNSQPKESRTNSVIKDMTIKEDRQINTDSESFYIIKHEYRNYPYVEINVPLLPPPKRVLDPGSYFWKSYDVLYSVNTSSERNPDVVTLTKQKFYYNHPKVGMFKARYRFDRIRDVSSEIKRHYKMIVYNLDTAKFYYITNQNNGKHKRTVRSIHQMSLNRTGLMACLTICDPIIRRRFMNIVMNHIWQAIPDAVVPSPPNVGILKAKTGAINVKQNILSVVENSSYQMEIFFSLFLQHKVGRKLDWAGDRDLLEKIDEMSSFCTVNPTDDYMKKIRKNCFYQIIPNLRKDSKADIKIITKTFFKYGYRNIMHELFMSRKNSFESIRQVMALSDAIYNKKLPKSTYHLIVHLMKLGSDYATLQLYRLMEAIESTCEHLYPGLQTNMANDLHILKLYTRTIQNFIKHGNYQMIGWTLFRDTINMASELGIRVRINKFLCVNDIAYIHDRFTEYQQRDLEAFNKYNNFEFLKFESPDKYYEEFRFIQLLTPADLVKEGKEMHHCVGGYSNRCLDGSSIIFSMFKDRSWVTIELNGNDQTYPIAQMYTIKDFSIRNSVILSIIEKWRSDVERMHSNDDTLYSMKARDYYEYQKNQIRLLELRKINQEELEPDEQKWVDRRIKEIEQRLLPVSEEVHHAQAYEQAVAQA